MIPIYLCDDEETVRHQIQTALEWKIFIENYDMKVVCAASAARALLEAVEDNRRGIYFLDVNLHDGMWDRSFAGGIHMEPWCISPATAIWPGKPSSTI